MREFTRSSWILLFPNEINLGNEVKCDRYTWKNPDYNQKYNTLHGWLATEGNAAMMVPARGDQSASSPGCLVRSSWKPLARDGLLPNLVDGEALCFITITPSPSPSPSLSLFLALYMHVIMSANIWIHQHDSPTWTETISWWFPLLTIIAMKLQWDRSHPDSSIRIHHVSMFDGLNLHVASFFVFFDGLN